MAVLVYLEAFWTVNPEEWVQIPRMAPKMTETKEEQSSVTEEEQETSKNDSRNGRDLFLYQLSLALEGDKEVIPKINFRRKHPQLGKKLSNHEIRIRKMEKTIAGLKKFLKPQILRGMENDLLKKFDKVKDQLIKDL